MWKNTLCRYRASLFRFPPVLPLGRSLDEGTAEGSRLNSPGLEGEGGDGPPGFNSPPRNPTTHRGPGNTPPTVRGWGPSKKQIWVR